MNKKNFLIFISLLFIIQKNSKIFAMESESNETTQREFNSEQKNKQTSLMDNIRDKFTATKNFFFGNKTTVRNDKLSSNAKLNESYARENTKRYLEFKNDDFSPVSNEAIQNDFKQLDTFKNTEKDNSTLERKKIQNSEIEAVASRIKQQIKDSYSKIENLSYKEMNNNVAKIINELKATYVNAKIEKNAAKFNENAINQIEKYSTEQLNAVAIFKKTFESKISTLKNTLSSKANQNISNEIVNQINELGFFKITGKESIKLPATISTEATASVKKFIEQNSSDIKAFIQKFDVNEKGIIENLNKNKASNGLKKILLELMSSIKRFSFSRLLGEKQATLLLKPINKDQKIEGVKITKVSAAEDSKIVNQEKAANSDKAAYDNKKYIESTLKIIKSDFASELANNKENKAKFSKIETELNKGNLTINDLRALSQEVESFKQEVLMEKISKNKKENVNSDLSSKSKIPEEMENAQRLALQEAAEKNQEKAKNQLIIEKISKNINNLSNETKNYKGAVVSIINEMKKFDPKYTENENEKLANILKQNDFSINTSNADFRAKIVNELKKDLKYIKAEKEGTLKN